MHHDIEFEVSDEMRHAFPSLGDTEIGQAAQKVLLSCAPISFQTTLLSARSMS